MSESVMSDDVQAHDTDRGPSADSTPATESTESTKSTRAADSTPAGGAASSRDDAGPGGTLVAAERARDYQSRWNALKGEFVDNPRGTLLEIDGLVGEVLDELEQTFRRQRGEIESGVRDDGSSTEELRLAFGRYREFFDRLLAI